MDRATLQHHLSQAAALVGNDHENYRRMQAALGGLDARSFILGMGAAAFALSGTDIVRAAELYPDLLDGFLNEATRRITEGNDDA